MFTLTNSSFLFLPVQSLSWERVQVSLSYYKGLLSRSRLRSRGSNSHSSYLKLILCRLAGDDSPLVVLWTFFIIIVVLIDEVYTSLEDQTYLM